MQPDRHVLQGCISDEAVHRGGKMIRALILLVVETFKVSEVIDDIISDVEPTFSSDS